MTAGQKQSYYGPSRGWVISLVAVTGLIIWGMAQRPAPTPTVEERWAQFESGERTHCAMFGMPSEEGQLMGFECP